MATYRLQASVIFSHAVMKVCENTARSSLEQCSTHVPNQGMIIFWAGIDKSKRSSNTSSSDIFYFSFIYHDSLLSRLFLFTINITTTIIIINIIVIVVIIIIIILFCLNGEAENNLSNNTIHKFVVQIWKQAKPTLVGSGP